MLSVNETHRSRLAEIFCQFLIPIDVLYKTLFKGPQWFISYKFFCFINVSLTTSHIEKEITRLDPCYL